MNASSLYVTVSRLVFQSGDSKNESCWTDLYRLIPYLRQSLSCTVCGNLLCEPYSPTDSPCQHHECRLCIGGRKNLKPSCSWCRDYKKYDENIQLRILLQCYKSLCEYIKLTPIYEGMQKQFQTMGSNLNVNNGNSVGTNSLVDIIDEGIRFQDEFKSAAGLTKAAYSILPCLYTNSPNTQSTKQAPMVTSFSPSSTASTTTNVILPGNSYSIGSQQQVPVSRVTKPNFSQNPGGQLLCR